MATEFQRLQLRPGGPRLHDRITPDVRYWSKYRKPTLVKESTFVNSLHFAEASPHLLAATSGAKVNIYHPSTHDLAKSITRFSDLAFSGHLRSDGKLLVAGDEAGQVNVFEMGSRSVLRCFKGHSGPVHLTRFFYNKTQVLSGSDDKIVNVWDIPTNAASHSFEEHTDYVRAGCVSKDNPHLILTGSYDHSVKLWDLRMQSSALTVDHGAPVESLMSFPGTNAFVCSGGPSFKVFDVVAGGKMLQHVSNHQKTITSLAFDCSGSRLLTGSLDQSVKIYNVANYKVVHTIKYPAPILALAVSPDDAHMAVAMLDGTLSLRSREVKADDVRSDDGYVRAYRTGSYKYFMRGHGYQPSSSDFQVAKQKKQQVKDWDVYLKKFEYANALDVLFQQAQPPALVISLIEELIDRNGLVRALQGRSEESLEPLLEFLAHNVTHPYYTATLTTVAHKLLDIYSGVVGRSEALQEKLGKIVTKIADERRTAEELAKVLGILDCVLANATKTSELQVTWKESDEEIIRRVVDAQEEQHLRAAEDRMRRLDDEAQGTSTGDSVAATTPIASPLAVRNTVHASADVHAMEVDDKDASALADEHIDGAMGHTAGELHGYLAKLECGEDLGVSFGGDWTTEHARKSGIGANGVQHECEQSEMPSLSSECARPGLRSLALPMADQDPTDLSHEETRYEMVIAPTSEARPSDEGVPAASSTPKPASGKRKGKKSKASRASHDDSKQARQHVVAAVSDTTANDAGEGASRQSDLPVAVPPPPADAVAATAASGASRSRNRKSKRSGGKQKQ